MESTYRTTHTISRIVENGVPLNVELSESLNRSRIPVKEQSSSCFVKASKIFLRLETSGSGTLKSLEEINSNESTDNEHVILTTNSEEVLNCNMETSSMVQMMTQIVYYFEQHQIAFTTNMKNFYLKVSKMRNTSKFQKSKEITKIAIS